MSSSTEVALPSDVHHQRNSCRVSAAVVKEEWRRYTDGTHPPALLAGLCFRPTAYSLRFDVEVWVEHASSKLQTRNVNGGRDKAEKTR
jgi:hypothetical protein